MLKQLLSRHLIERVKNVDKPKQISVIYQKMNYLAMLVKKLPTLRTRRSLKKISIFYNF